MKNRGGFTLLELMVSLGILAALSVLTSQTIQQAIKNKLKIQSQIDEMSQVRDALKIMERDINSAFHYRDLELEFSDLIKKKSPPQPSTDPSAATAPENRVNPETHFIGKEKSLIFTTMNSSRLYSHIPQADFIKVGYSLEDCRLPGEKTTETVGCLLRKNSLIVEGDPEKTDHKNVLLTHVTELKFRYKGMGQTEWQDEWSSLYNEAKQKGNFPQAVEVTLTRSEGEGKKKKKITMQIVAIIRFPNNKLPKTGGS